MESKVLVTICGRKGSQGLKNKNTKRFLDAPLVYYTLSAASLFTEQMKGRCDVDICINTDSPSLVDIVNEKYPEVFFIDRPEELGSGAIPKSAIWKNCLEYMAGVHNRVYDYLIDLDITSPLRRASDVMNAFCLKVARQDCDMVESVCLSRRNPYFNMVKEEDGFLTTVIDNSYTERQQAPKVYDENASIYVLKADYFDVHNTNRVNHSKRIAYEMRDTAVLDIDCEEDYTLMQVIAKHLYETCDDYRLVRDNIRM